MALKCSLCRQGLTMLAAFSLIVAMSPVLVPAMLVYARCSGGGNIKG